MPIACDVIHQLLATDVAPDKRGARRISAEEAEQYRTTITSLFATHTNAVGAARACCSSGIPMRPRTYARHRTDRGPHYLVDRDWLELDRAGRKLFEASR